MAFQNDHKFANVHPLHDGKPLGKAEDVVLHIPLKRTPYAVLMGHLHKQGWDCNGASFDCSVSR